MTAIAGLRFEKHATAVGTYWTSRASKHKLRASLRDMATTHYKIVSFGGDQEQSFEQSFSSLAYSYLKDKAPRLLDFIIGFQPRHAAASHRRRVTPPPRPSAVASPRRLSHRHRVARPPRRLRLAFADRRTW